MWQYVSSFPARLLWVGIGRFGQGLCNSRRWYDGLDVVQRLESGWVRPIWKRSGGEDGLESIR